MFPGDQITDPAREVVGPPTESERVILEAGGTIKKKPGSWLRLHGNKEAKAINYNGIARGAINMSNVYLANSLIHLACRAGGGFDPEDRYCADYSVTVYGMKPIALITNIAAIAPVLAALAMPPIGAVIDYTRHRKMVGVATAALLAIITGIQIGTVYDTWFAMAILQSIIFAIYQLQVMALFAYFPELADEVGEKRMNSFTSTWSFWQFISQSGVNMVILLVSFGFKLGVVHTAMVSQGIVFAISVVTLTMCWCVLPQRPPKHKLPKGDSLAIAGFRQNFSTCKKIWVHYKVGLKWFLISTIFSEASASAVGTTAVAFLNGNLGLKPLQIGIFFEISLVGVVFGTKLGGWFTKLTNPRLSLLVSQLGLGVTVAGGVWGVQDLTIKELSWIWGFTIGVFLGWFYPAENIFFSMIVPKNQETELSGFFAWASQILAPLPPLVYTIMVQSGISLAWAQTFVGLVFAVSIGLLCLSGSWEEILEETKRVSVSFIPEDGVDGESEANSGVMITNGDKRDSNATEQDRDEEIAS